MTDSKDIQATQMTDLRIPEMGAESVIDAFMASIDAKETTRKTYRKGIDYFFRWILMTSRNLGTMMPPDIIAYKDYLTESGHSVPTINLYLSIVRKFYRWTKNTGLYPNIADSVSSIKADKSKFRKMHLESEQGAALIETVSTPKTITGHGVRAKMLSDIEAVIAKRNHALVNLMLRTGLRTIEVSRADIGDIKTRRNRTVLYVWGKGHSEKDNFVILTEEAFNPIREYLKCRKGADDTEPLFVCEGYESKGRRLSTRRIQAICKEALKEIGLTGHEYSAHSLRHTTGTEILKNGGSMFDVQNVLRHSTPATSQLYVNTIIEEKRLDDAGEHLLDGSFKTEKQ